MSENYEHRQQMYENLWGPNAPERTAVPRYEMDLSFDLTIDSDLIQAIHSGEPNNFEDLLLRFPSYDINKDLKGYQNLLTQTVKSGNPDMLRVALRYGADVQGVDGEGRTALMYAAVHNQPEMIDILVNQGANIDQRVPVLGYTALHLASIQGADAAVERLLAHGADTQVQTFDGKIPAAFAGNEACFEHFCTQRRTIDNMRMLLTLDQQMEDVRTVEPDLRDQLARYRARPKDGPSSAPGPGL